MRIHFRPVSQWPPLAWLAECSRSGGDLVVYHGEKVEVRENFFCEAVWAGEFTRGDFHMTDAVMGSGGRLVGDGIVFVSSGSTIDRLQYLDDGKKAWISNSLACLASFVDATLDPACPDYPACIASISRGVSRYSRYVETSAGSICLVYFDNVLWDGTSLSVISKPGGDEDFGSFDKYHAFLSRQLEQIAVNMSASERLHPYQFMGTLSSGYDSATCTVLARPFGLSEAVTFTAGRGGAPDNGAEVAHTLGIKVTEVGRDEWRGMVVPEPLFITADGGGADIMFAGLSRQLSMRVLLTGYYGDNVWGKDGVDLTGDFVRKSRSGLSLSEFRLKAGFINFPVAYLGGRQIAQINAICRSEEMKPWDVEGTYSRPIPRRIVEEAGVARTAFGMKKNAAVHQFASEKEFLSTRSRIAYVEWLQNNQEAFRKRSITPPGKFSPFVDRARVEALHGIERWARSGLRFIAKLPLFWRLSHSKRLQRFRTITYDGRLRGYRQFVYPWALERAKASYPKPRG